MKKKLFVAVLAIMMLGAFAACSVTQVAGMSFSVAPASSYMVTDTPNVDASRFTVQVDMEDGTVREFALTNSLLTVQGLVNGCLDTTTVGQKTLRVSYRGFSFTFTYTVTAEKPEEGDTWEKHTETVNVAFSGANETISVESAAQLAGFAYKLNNQTGEVKAYTGKLTLAANIDLGAYQWVPIKNFAGTFNGNNYTISNLNIVDSTDREEGTKNTEGRGLFNTVKPTKDQTALFQNVTLDGFYMEQTNDQAMYSKNYGALIGLVDNIKEGSTNEEGGPVTIKNITVTNAYIKATARIGGIVGQSRISDKLTIDGCYVQGSFTAINPVTVTTADGEGDKIGGIIGQAGAENKAATTITNCTVNVKLAGTRDIGGIAGFIHRGTISGCEVLSGTELRASIPGGMLYEKGTRNVGGIAGIVSISVIIGGGNTVASDVIMVSNSLYEHSNTNWLIGGVRGQAEIMLVKGTTTTTPEEGEPETITTYYYYYLTNEQNAPVYKAENDLTAEPTNVWDAGKNTVDSIGKFNTEQKKMILAMADKYLELEAENSANS